MTLFRLVGLITLVTLISSCMQGNYGHFRRSWDITELFESGIILEDHKYYYYGPDAKPEAILALHEKYALAPSLWKEAKLTKEKLLFWMEIIDREHRLGSNYMGAMIVGPDDNMIGYWYAKHDNTVVKKGPNNQMIIYTPYTPRSPLIFPKLFKRSE